jgi:hypothetical protein
LTSHLVEPLLVAGALMACGTSDTSTSPSSSSLPQRTFRMGFSALPPKATNESALATIEAWSKRADAAIMHTSVPYRALLTGTSATTYVNTVDLPLANLYKGKGLPLIITVDVTDGLNRAAENPDLVAMRRSITEPAVQAVYRQYVQALASIIKPDYLGLAAETNLIREQAPAAVYTALVQMANAAAGDVRSINATLPLYVSLQADVAWGPPPAAYRGVETDFRDFPFTRVIAISSYPYFVYPDPDQIPLDYYARLLNGRSLPVMVVEGGWTSASAGSIQSSPAKQARYLRRQERLLDSANAVAVFQLSYTDLDVSAYPQGPGSILPLFAQIGLVDTDLRAKAALATYDSIFARPLRK